MHNKSGPSLDSPSLNAILEFVSDRFLCFRKAKKCIALRWRWCNTSPPFIDRGHLVLDGPHEVCSLDWLERIPNLWLIELVVPQGGSLAICLLPKLSMEFGWWQSLYQTSWCDQDWVPYVKHLIGEAWRNVVMHARHCEGGWASHYEARSSSYLYKAQSIDQGVWCLDPRPTSELNCWS